MSNEPRGGIAFKNPAHDACSGRMKIAVIGAGPAGLTAAYCLSKTQPGVEVYEAADTVGGLARSLRLWNQTVDTGPHRFFSRDKRVNELWLEVVGRDYSMVNRLTRILYGRKFYSYPLRPFETLANLGLVEAARCLASYAGERFQPTPPDGTFESWVRGRFGRRLFEIFFKTYSEKLWGIRCDELDADFAAQRIKQFSLGAAIKGAFAARHRAAHRTMVEQFAYPNEGTGMVYTRMAQAVASRGGRVHLRTPVEAVLTEKNRITGLRLPDGTVKEYDHVISTMPLTLLVQRLPETPPEVLAASKGLTFRNTILVYLEVAQSDLCRDNWIYIHSPDLRAGRVTNFRNWSPQLYGDSPNTILALEYWCHDGEELWLKKDAELIALATREIIATALVKDAGLVKNGLVYRIPRCYPVYRCGYKKLLQPIQEYLSRVDGLQVIGRYGAFKYNNQDHSILMGLLAAENILKNAKNDLWAVNSDYDNYQEGCLITETGLVPQV
jgi:protoporphyrinogen oxidase